MLHISNQSQSPKQSVSQLLTYAIVILPLMGAWGVYLYFGLGSLVASKSTAPTSVIIDDVQPDVIPSREKPVTDTSPFNYESHERIFVLNLQKHEFDSRIAGADKQLATAAETEQALVERIQSLLTSDHGRRLAFPDAAQKFLFVQEHFENRRNLFRDAQQTLREVRANSPALSSVPIQSFSALFANISKAEVNLVNFERVCREVNTTLDTMLAKMPTQNTRTLNSVLSSLSSESQALANVRAQEQLDAAKSRFERMVLTSEEQRRRLESQLASAKAELAAATAGSTGALTRAKNNSRRVAENRALEKQRKAAAMRAAYPAVRQLLQPFTSNGYRQPNGKGRFVVTPDSSPISYSGLLSNGALNSNQQGLKKLFHLVQAKGIFGPPNDRPLGDFPVYRNFSDFDQPNTQRKLKQAQNFLIEHGEAMVNVGLLSQ